MAATNITFDDKILGQANALPENKKLTHQNANEIKAVVNNNAAELNSLDGTNIELIKGGGIYIDNAIIDLQNATLQDITDNGNLTSNPIVTPSVNGASITSSGDGNSYLANDGTYKVVSGAVNSVNGQTGVVILDGTNIEVIKDGGIYIDDVIVSLQNTKLDLGGDIGGTFDVPTINDEAITNAKLAHIPTNRIKGRASSGNGDVEDLTVPQTKAVLSIDQVDNTSDLDKPLSTATADALNLIDLDIISLYADKINKNVGNTYTTNALTTVTQAEYDAIDTPDASTIYFII